MFLIILAFICALSISGVAIYYSVLGLGAIFAAAKVPIYIMGGVLEIAKLVTASWLYQNWKNIPFLLKTYLTLAVGILMIITSLGIFGFLSKAHIEQATPASEVTAKIDRIEEQIIREESNIKNLTGKIDRLQGGSADTTTTAQIEREQAIIDNAGDKIKADVELIQTKINNTQKQIDDITTASNNQIKDIQADADKKIDIARSDSKTEIDNLRTDQNAIIDAEQNKLAALDKAVNDVLNANKSFFNEEKESELLKERQGPERESIAKKITNAQNKITTGTEQINSDLDATISSIQSTADGKINNIRTDANTQITELRGKIEGFNAEISTLQASVEKEVADAKQRINDINTDAIADQDNAEIIIEGLEIKISESYDKIDELKAEQFIEESKIRDLEAEVGPIKYIAQFFDRDGEVDLEKAVTWLIIVIMFVFDPLAVLLLIAVNMSLKARYGWNFEGNGQISGKDLETLDLRTPKPVKDLENTVEHKYKGDNNVR